MTRLERLEKHGWKIVVNMASGTISARHKDAQYKGMGTHRSITYLHKKYFGY